MDAAQAQVWFTDLYNYSVVPYLLEAVREGIQVNAALSVCVDVRLLLRAHYSAVRIVV